MTKLNIVTGFLGAGKTTYINKLLACLQGEKVAIIVNDFGEQNIDAELYNSDVFALSDGCVCCSLKHEFSQTLKSLTDFDRIIFEPSGVFMLGEMELGEVELSITCIVDGLNFYSQKADFGEFIDNQIRFASRVVVSKADKCNVASVVDDIETLYPNVEVIAKPYSSFSKEDFLGNGKAVSLKKITSHVAPLCFSRQVNRQFSSFLVKQVAKNFKNGVYGNVIRAKAVLPKENGSYLLNVVASEVSIEEIEMRKGAVSCMGETLALAMLKRDFF